ncbi:hypothetical protein [Rasiella sp. SM2506]|uniref:hypothetical protein n=1 Tax=Rasiella sp. SM2506 TaxID=3423914 RepID=UPI003D7AAE37
MYITIKTKKLETQGYMKSGMGDDLMNADVNFVIDLFIDEIKPSLKKEVCPNHGVNSKGTIIVSSNSKGKIKVEKTHFCCKEFSDSIDFGKR